MKIIDATTPAEDCARVLRCRFPGLAGKVRVFDCGADVNLWITRVYVSFDDTRFYAGLIHQDVHTYKPGPTPLRALIALLRALSAPNTDPGLSGQVTAQLQQGMALILAADREGRELGGRTWDQVPG